MKKIMILVSLLFLLFIMNPGCVAHHPRNISEINEKYYYIKNSDSLKILCDVYSPEIITLQNLVESERKTKKQEKDSSAIRFQVSIDKGQMIKVRSSGTTGGLNQKTNCGLDLAIEGVKDIIESFLSIWVELTFERVFSENSSDYTIKKQANSYSISLVNPEISLSTHLYDNFMRMNATLAEKDAKMSLSAAFEYTPKGNRLIKYSASNDDNGFTIKYYIEYLDIYGYYFPKKVYVENIFDNKIDKITLNFENYKIEK